MSRIKAEELMKDFRVFFSEIPGFKEVETPGRIRFVCEYPEKNLRIYVAMPILKTTTDEYRIISGQLFITFAIQHDKKTCLEFRDSRATKDWQKIVSKKIDTMKKLIDGSRPCIDPACKGAYPKPIEESARQGKPKPTRYAVFECTGGCRARTETKYGIGLKTAVSKYL